MRSAKPVHDVSWMIRSAGLGRAFLTSASVSLALVAFALFDCSAAGSAGSSAARGASLLPEVWNEEVMLSTMRPWDTSAS